MHATLTCCNACHSPQQTYDEVLLVLKSLTRIKGVRISIGAAFWGEEYAAEAEKPSFTGVIDRWANATDKTALYVMWEGYSRNQLAPLDKMDTDSHDNSLELRLLPYADGRAPPTLQAARPTQPHAAAGQGGEQVDDEESGGNEEEGEEELGEGEIVEVH